MYIQHDGAVITLAHTLANIFMGFLESKIIPKFKNELHFFRYVDDFYNKNETDMDDFYKILNKA